MHLESGSFEMVRHLVGERHREFEDMLTDWKCLAEFGAAVHWIYKECLNASKKDDDDLDKVDNVLGKEEEEEGDQ